MDIYIVGVGMTPFGKFPELAMKDLAHKAINDALTDAGCEKSAIQSTYFANTTMGYMENQVFIPGPIALHAMGFKGIPMMTIENACASGSTAMWEAINFIRSGAGDVALAAGAEKMNIPDKVKALSIFDSGWELATAEENYKRLMRACGDDYVPNGTVSPDARSRFMDIYAAMARYHMDKYGLTQRQIAFVSAKNHRNSVHNPRSFYRKPFTVDEVLATKAIMYPLTVAMCAPLTDGGAAAILCNEKALAKYGFNRTRAVKVNSCVLMSGTDHKFGEEGKGADSIAAKKAYEEAGVGPEDINVAEVHDATAFGEIVAVENLGLCKIGEGGEMAERGETSLGGRIPVNPSGGLECKGHPLGATGLAQIFELVSQLRGECGPRQVNKARIALLENGGGMIGFDAAAMVVCILGAVESLGTVTR